MNHIPHSLWPLAKNVELFHWATRLHHTHTRAHILTTHSNPFVSTFRQIIPYSKRTFSHGKETKRDKHYGKTGANLDCIIT